MAFQTHRGHPMIVAVDYGTTFTGFATSTADRGVYRPPATPPLGKVPSRIAYLSDNGVPQSNEFEWGLNINPGMQAHSWTKMRLDEHAPQTENDDQDAQRIAAGLGIFRHLNRPPVNVIADYLGQVYSESLRLPELRNDVAVDFWISHPAGWSQLAIDNLKKAVNLAGFGRRAIDRVTYISEPEAAVWAAVHEPNLTLRVGDAVLICDCGGGTTDLAAWGIDGLSPLKLSRISTAEGAKCGGAAIDLHFYDFMRDRFGEAFTELPLHLIGPGSLFMDRFEQLKRDFRPGLNHEISLPLQMNVRAPNDQQYQDGEVLMSYNDFLGFFDPVIDEIQRRIVRQKDTARLLIDATGIIRIILVGGLSRSPYVQHRLRTQLQANDTVVTVPNNPQLAVARGAVFRGINIYSRR